LSNEAACERIFHAIDQGRKYSSKRLGKFERVGGFADGNFSFFRRFFYLPSMFGAQF
jgi:hypothetical protein